MLARAILILSCVFCTRVSAQEAAPASADESAAPTPTPPPAPIEQSVQSAVPVDREALVPATEPAPKRPLESDPMFTPAVVLIGTGGAALLASLFTGLGAHGIYTSLESDCKNNICSSDKADSISSGKTLAVVSTVLTGAGIVAAGIGTTLLVLAATREDEPPKQSNFGFSSLRLTGGPTPLGVGAAGSF
jgi:hypothetical protein